MFSRMVSLLLLLSLSACGHMMGAPPIEVRYVPPGPPTDPWGPYLKEAAERFSMPEAMVRSVMMQESGGRQEMNGKPITSRAGAMGLMQLMPGTWREVSRTLGLGSSPWNPRENILAGTWYLRGMTRAYGVRGGFAAYNWGPGAYQLWLDNGGEMPEETEKYMDTVEAAYEARAALDRAEAARARQVSMRARAELMKVACVVPLRHVALPSLPAEALRVPVPRKTVLPAMPVRHRLWL